MYAAATKKGKISTFPKTAGLLVFIGTSTSSISHVGVYGGDGYVYEAKGHRYGVVKSAYSASNWNFWVQCPYTTDDTTGTTSSSSTTTTSTTTESSSTTTEKKATDPAKSYLSSLAGTYKTTANLNMRNGAGTGKSILVTLPKNQTVTCYGYYTTYNGTKWLYVVAVVGSIKYTGFCSSAYLSKQ